MDEAGGEVLLPPGGVLQLLDVFLDGPGHDVEAGGQLFLSVRAEDGVLQGDPALLQTLVQNLLDNARKASQPGGHVVLEGTRP